MRIKTSYSGRNKLRFSMTPRHGRRSTIYDNKYNIKKGDTPYEELNIVSYLQKQFTSAKVIRNNTKIESEYYCPENDCSYMYRHSAKKRGWKKRHIHRVSVTLKMDDGDCSLFMMKYPKGKMIYIGNAQYSWHKV